MYKLADGGILQGSNYPLLIAQQFINLDIFIVAVLFAVDPELILPEVLHFLCQFTIDRQPDLLHEMALGRCGRQLHRDDLRGNTSRTFE